MTTIATNIVVIYAHAIDAVNRQLAWVSEDVKSLLGYDVDECRAVGWWTDRLHPDDRAGVLARLPALWSGGRLVCEYRLRTRGGSYRWLRDEVRLIRNLAGEPMSCVGSWSELTERSHAADPLSEPELSDMSSSLGVSGDAADRGLLFSAALRRSAFISA